MKTVNHTHELRLHDYRKGINHVEILVKGNFEDCFDFVTIKAQETGCGTGLLLNNCGYSIIDLSKERIEKIQRAGVTLYNTLKDVLKMENGYGDLQISKGGKFYDEILAAIKEAEQ